MRARIMRITDLLVCLLVLCICASNAPAQNEPITVEVELSRTRLYVGDELSYQVVVRNADNPSAPELDFPASVQAQYHGRTSQSFTSVQSINGRTRTVTDQRFSFQYTLTALEEGTVTIPAPTITIDGQRYTGEPATFEALFPTRSDSDEMEMRVERDTIYQNETVEVQCVWWIGDQTSDFSMSSTRIPDSFEVRAIDPPARGGDRVTFPFNGEQLTGIVDTGMHDGRPMKRFSFGFSITPTQTGSFDLGPLRAVFTRLSGTGRGFRAYIESPTIPLTVRPVPSQGRPEGYAGAIGDFTLDAGASNTTVNVGDPITLTLRISGDEPMVGIEDAPDLSADPRFSDRFKIDSSGWREQLPRERGQRVYQTTIRAVNDQVDQIPPIRLPSFSPEIGDYKVFESAPIELAVNPVQEVTLSDAVVSSGSAPSRTPRQSEGIERVPLTRAMPGLWAHGSAEDMLEQHGFDLGRTVRQPVWIAALASGPTLFALALGVTLVRRSGDARTRALRKAYSRARWLGRHGQHALALRVYLAAALGIDERAVTASDAGQLPIDEETADSLSGELTRNERSGYVEGPETNTHTGAGIIQLLHQIHRQVLHAKGVVS